MWKYKVEMKKTVCNSKLNSKVRSVMMKRSVNVAAVCILSLTGAVLMGSCKKKDVKKDVEKDNEKPTIEIVTPNKENHDVAPGGTLKVMVKLTDNDELGSVKLDFHWAGDGHKHEGHHHGLATLRTRGEGTEKFHYNWDTKLSGKSQTVEHEIKIPENAKHDAYHLAVFCTDKSGNEAKAFQDVHIEEEGE